MKVIKGNSKLIDGASAKDLWADDQPLSFLSLSQPPHSINPRERERANCINLFLIQARASSNSGGGGGRVVELITFLKDYLPRAILLLSLARRYIILFSFFFFALSSPFVLSSPSPPPLGSLTFASALSSARDYEFLAIFALYIYKRNGHWAIRAH